VWFAQSPIAIGTIGTLDPDKPASSWHERIFSGVENFVHSSQKHKNTKDVGNVVFGLGQSGSSRERFAF
jgi:hypothetical protein